MHKLSPFKLSGGSRKKRTVRRHKKGGNLSGIVNEAIVPFGLMGLQQNYKKKANKGGNFSGIVNEAIVPFGLMGLQQTYKKKASKGGKTRKHRRH